MQIEGIRSMGTQYLAWKTGPMVVFTNVSDDLVAAVPDGLEGIVYAALVSDNTDTTIDNHLLSSYVFLDFTFSSYAPNAGIYPN